MKKLYNGIDFAFKEWNIHFPKSPHKLLRSKEIIILWNEKIYKIEIIFMLWGIVSKCQEHQY